jgi:magnesium transporter
MSDVITPSTAETENTGLRVLVDRPGLLWLDLSDPMSSDLDRLAERYGFHELAIEDCRTNLQLAKIDYYEGYSFFIVNTTHYSEKPCEVRLREINVFLGPDYIVTVHFGASHAVADVERRIGSGFVKTLRPDGILHGIIDVVVDRYHPTMDMIGETIDRVQDDLLVRPDIHLLETIFALKRGLLQFRRAAASQRELLNSIVRDESGLIDSEMRIYFRDVYDHAVRGMDLIETYRDLLTGALDIYLTQMANRTNDIVKGLTILATIMLPLTLVTGFFGMNFDYIPLAKHPLGIWITTGFLLMIAIVMLGWFRHKKWI